MQREQFEIDPVERALDQWRQHMRAWSAEDRLGYPTRSPAFVTGSRGGGDAFEQLCDEADSLAGHAMEAIVDGLEPIERAALCHVYLHTVYRFRDLDAVLARAKAKIRRKLPSRGLV